MARVEGEEVEYQSDAEEAKLPLTTRRSESSNDEEVEVDQRGMPLQRVDSRVSDRESVGESAGGGYDNEKSDVEEEKFGKDVELEKEKEKQCVKRESVSDAKVLALKLDEDSGITVGVLSGSNLVEEGKIESDVGDNFEDDQFVDNAADWKEEVETEETEPFVVPTAASYYMHDDRFEDKLEDSSDGHHRHTLGGRKLRESRDDRKWVHDKFKELTMGERQQEEGRRVSRGRNHGRGKGRGEEHAYPRGNRTKVFDYKNQTNAPDNPGNAFNNQSYVLDRQNISVNSWNDVPDRVRGRGPRRYQPTWKKNKALAEPKEQSGNSVQRSSYDKSGRVSELTWNADNDSGTPRKHVSSSLNYASPPFYPSASSGKEVKLRQEMDGQLSPLHQDPHAFVGDESFSIPQSNTMQGKNTSDLVGINKLYIDDSLSTYIKKPLTNLQLKDSESSSVDVSQTLQSGVQRKGQAPMGQLAYQPNAPHNQVNRVPTSSQASNIQRVPNKSRGQAALRASAQQFGQRSWSGNQTSSPPNVPLSTNTFEPRGIDCMPESSKLRTALVGKAKGSARESRRSSFPYGASQVMGGSGNNGSATGDNKLSANPTFLPFMQFGGQHTGGMGVPAVGMAIPGYVGNPELGHSEMTWLPVLAGAAGAMGATYPFLSADGAYNAHASGQTPMAAASSKESNMNKLGNELKPSQRPDLANDDFGQRQNKPQRYTEMKFDQ